MPDHELERSSTNEGLPIAPSLGDSLIRANFPTQRSGLDKRVILIAAYSVVLALAAVLIAQALLALIALATNISFYGEFSFEDLSPAHNTLGLFVIAVPIIGGLIVGIMARYGSKAIRGHGIPEAMEQVLLNESKINPLLTFLKPVSTAIAIGTGGPFGAEGPIIATGGALGSFVGQIFKVTANERKTLLTAGAAAGMTAIFGTPLAAVLLAIELLLFEFKAKSVIPVALACVTAMGARIVFEGFNPVFPMPTLVQPGGEALILYVVIGALIGLCSVLVTKSVYAIEDAFERLPIHWMWWPALGAIAIGVIGFFVPRTLGVGYNNITDILSGNFTLQAVAILGLMKFLSWSISLGSGTSGGTMAPLFTIGGALGIVFGTVANILIPAAAIDIRIAALVGMASLFAGASRALLTSVAMAFELTLQPIGLLPLLGGCTASYLLSALLMKNSIMTEKIERRGVRVPSDYQADFLDRIKVSDVTSRDLISLAPSETIEEIREWITSQSHGSSHQGFPIISDTGGIMGVLTRRDIFDPNVSPSTSLKKVLKRTPVCVYEDCSLREAADHMVNHNVGRLPVIQRGTGKTTGIITRSDILMAHRSRIAEHTEESVAIDLKEYIPRATRK
jgi:chloride channel protein, CIC family